jgi:hypothetical protein
MINPFRTAFIAVAIMAITAAVNFLDPRGSSALSGLSWQEDFGIADCHLVPTGRNRYFILEPGFQIILEDKKEKLAITVLDETKQVDGVTTRIVEEREWKNGELVEVSRNFYAICESTKDVFYFGEDVDDYQGGKIVGHGGAWIAGKSGARAGLMMPGNPKVGMKYYQELAPNVAMDRAEIVGLDATLETPAGSFAECLKIEESTPLNLLEKGIKIYAPGIGIIQDANLRLTGHGFIQKK